MVQKRKILKKSKNKIRNQRTREIKKERSANKKVKDKYS